jgi:aconitate hydratase
VQKGRFQSNGRNISPAAVPVSEFAARVKKEGFTQKMEVGLIGSCTNSSYQDLSRAASVARQVKAKGLKMQASLIINPGSEQVYCTAQRDGMIEDLKSIGGVVMTNACGPCIGQWKRVTDDPLRANSIVTSFNRNFAKRADGNPNTHAFIASPEMAVTFARFRRLHRYRRIRIPYPDGRNQHPCQEADRTCKEYQAPAYREI